MSNTATKISLSNLFKRLTPNAASRNDITSVDDIDKAPVPKFSVENTVTVTPEPAPPSLTLTNKSGPEVSPPGAGNVAVQTLKTVTVLSEPALITVSDRFGGGSIESEFVTAQGVSKEDVTKAVKAAAVVPRSASFEIFNRTHLIACDGLIQVLYYIGPANLPEAIDYARQWVNEELLNYCINVVSRHRPEFVSASIQLPSHITSHPSTYVDVSKLDSLLYAREIKGDGKQITAPIEIESKHDFTATDADPEHLVAYFREDVGINLHHRHWHEVYPNTGPKEITNLDRRGELFVYMHSQLLARYNFERLCNALNPVEKFSNFKEPIMQAYYPKLDEASEVKVWSPRQPFAQLQDVNRDGLAYEVRDLERWLERLIDTIDRGYAVRKDPKTGDEEKIKLEEPNAINDLGNTVDTVPSLSYNYDYYGDLHTTGHILIAYCHDPEKRFREAGGVMGKLEAALRDPMFYRWHAFIDDVMDRYKRKLPAYTLEQRLWEHVEIESVVIDSGKGEKNVIDTYWQLDRVDVTDGILSLKEVDLKKRPSKVFVKFKHLQHRDFNYRFTVYNWLSKPTTGIVRIFMAPARDETRNPMKFNKLRRFMIELDKFTVKLKLGKNEFARPSTCSSVTVPFEQTFMTFDQAEEYSTDEKKRQELLSYCGCGLPHHMLIGRGRKGGFPCTLFVMITDYDEDKVPDSSIESCGSSSISFCGVRNKKYPDKRPMGFPFDRTIPDNEATLSTFMTKSQSTHDVGDDRTPVRNMYATEFNVRFSDKIEKGITCDDTCTIPQKTDTTESY